MALATRCPQCGAMFRVVADQLKLRGGLVRCGQCRTVFDAIGSLAYVEDGALAGGRAPADSASSSAAESSGVAASGVDTERAATPAPGAAPGPASATVPAPAPTPAAVPAPAASSTPPPVPAPAAVQGQDGGAAMERSSVRISPERPRRTERTSTGRRSRNEQEQQRKALGPATTLRIAPGAAPVATVSQVMPEYVERRAPAEAEQESLGVPTLLAAGGASTDTDTSTDDDADPMLAGIEVIEVPPLPEVMVAPPSPDEEPAFARSGGTRTRRGFSIVFSGGSLLLLLIALLQTAVVFRAELTTRWPQARPMMVKLCNTLGCTLGLPTRPEQLAVIASELQAVAGTDVLELTAVIRNRASFTQALPALEVTLSDTQSRALARKVFAPVDYLAAAGEPRSRIEEGLAAGGDLTIRVLFEARGLRPAGFLVYPFYI